MLSNLKYWNEIKEIASLFQTVVIIVGLPISLIQMCTAQKQAKIQSQALKDSNKIASANYILE